MADHAVRVLKLVTEADYRPMTLKAMARHLQISGDDYPEFDLAVKTLVKEGKLELGRDKTLRRPDHSDAIVGLFRRSSKGFGFVEMASSGEAAKAIETFNGAELKGRSIRVDEARPKEPRSGGGGGGGRDRGDRGGRGGQRERW
jgi:ribonuclease R